MELLIKREPKLATGETFGRLYVNGISQMWTLDPHIIPDGRFRVVLYDSPRFHRQVPLLTDVPGHDFLEIHPGNTIHDTHGCVLVGISRSGKSVHASDAAFESLMKDFAAVKPSEQVWITFENQAADDQS